MLVTIAPIAFAATQVIAQQRTCFSTTLAPFQGSLRAINQQGELTLATEEGDRVVSPDDLVTWGALQDSADGTQVLLADGSVIVADQVQLDGETLLVDAKLFGRPSGLKIAGTSRLPVSAVRAVIYRMPLQPLQRDALFERIQQAEGNQDQLWLANGDLLQGSVRVLQPGKIELQTPDGQISIDAAGPRWRLQESVSAVVFNPLLLRSVRPEGPRTLVGFADGSRLFVKQFRPAGERMIFEMAGGPTIESHPDENIVERITSLQNFSPKLQYLSNLQPHRYLHTPLLKREWSLGVDKNVVGGRLRAGGNLYLRGIGMHSVSGVVYALRRPYRRFEAELAIDESAGRQGSAEFRISVVAAEGKQELLTETLRGSDEPRHVSVDLTGARAIMLLVSDADHGTMMDRANWLNARLIE